MEMRHRCGSNKWLLCRSQTTSGLRCTIPVCLLRQKAKSNMHSIRKKASWCEDDDCSSGEINPLDILHHCTEPLSLKSFISCPQPAWLKWKSDAVSLITSLAGRDWWWEPLRPATSACFLMEFAFTDEECEEFHGPSLLMKQQQSRPSSDRLLSAAQCWHAATKVKEWNNCLILAVYSNECIYMAAVSNWRFDCTSQWLDECMELF